MRCPKILTIMCVATFLSAQGLTPRTSPADYPAHTTLDKGFILAAENLLHSVPTPNGALVANDYLVIEAAVFAPASGPAKQRIDLTPGNFSLRIDTGKSSKMMLHADSPGNVAASIKYADWTQRPEASVSGGVGNAGGTIGTQTPVGRFPGDPSVRQPYPSPVPQDNPGGIDKEPPMPIDERIQRASLPQGEHVPPFAGLLFFQFRGKTKSIKSIELVYEGPAGQVTLKLD
jgi:hypothetical protein